MTVISSITLNAGTLNSNTGTATNGLAVGREWINGGGTFLTNSSSVTFTGSDPLCGSSPATISSIS